MSEISGIRPDIRYPVFKMAGYLVGRISGKTSIRSIPKRESSTCIHWYLFTYTIILSTLFIEESGVPVYIGVFLPTELYYLHSLSKRLKYLYTLVSFHQCNYTIYTLYQRE